MDFDLERIMRGAVRAKGLTHCVIGYYMAEYVTRRAMLKAGVFEGLKYPSHIERYQFPYPDKNCVEYYASIEDFIKSRKTLLGGSQFIDPERNARVMKLEKKPSQGPMLHVGNTPGAPKKRDIVGVFRERAIAGLVGHRVSPDKMGFDLVFLQNDSELECGLALSFGSHAHATVSAYLILGGGLYGCSLIDFCCIFQPDWNRLTMEDVELSAVNVFQLYNKVSPLFQEVAQVACAAGDNGITEEEYFALIRLANWS